MDTSPPPLPPSPSLERPCLPLTTGTHIWPPLHFHSGTNLSRSVPVLQVHPLWTRCNNVSCTLPFSWIHHPGTRTSHAVRHWWGSNFHTERRRMKTPERESDQWSNSDSGGHPQGFPARGSKWRRHKLVMAVSASTVDSKCSRSDFLGN